MTQTTEPAEPHLQPNADVVPPVRSAASRRFAIGLLAIVVVAAAVRITYTVFVADDLPLGGDAVSYHLQAAHLAAGNGYVRAQDFLVFGPSAEFPPLFPVVLSVVDRFGGDSITTQRLFTGMLGVGTVLLVGLTGRRVGGSTVGLIAAGLAAIYPMLFGAEGALMAESLYALLVSGFLLVVYLALERPTIVRWVVAGVLIGLAALTRTEAILLVPLVVVPEVLRRGGITARAWSTIGLSTVAALVVVTPWIVRNAVVFDRFIPISNNSGTLLAGANCDGTYDGDDRGLWHFACVTAVDTTGVDEAEMADRLRESGLDYARDHLSEVPGVMTVRVLRTFGLYEPTQQIEWDELEGRDAGWQTVGHRMFLVLLPFAVAGTVLLWRARRPVWPLLAPVVAVVLTSAFSYGNQRFRILAEPGMLILAAVPLAALMDRLRVGFDKPR